MPSDEEHEGRLTDVEFALWGVRGQGGVVEELRALRAEFQQYRLEEKKRREIEEKERKADRRWQVGIAFTIIMAILAAASIVAQGVAAQGIG